jgi:hypothetical protein
MRTTGPVSAGYMADVEPQVPGTIVTAVPLLLAAAIGLSIHVRSGRLESR